MYSLNTHFSLRLTVITFPFFTSQCRWSKLKGPFQTIKWLQHPSSQSGHLFPYLSFLLVSLSFIFLLLASFSLNGSLTFSVGRLFWGRPSRFQRNWCSSASLFLFFETSSVKQIILPVTSIFNDCKSTKQGDLVWQYSLYVEGQKKTTSQGSRSQARYSNFDPREYEAELLTSQAQSSLST